MPQQAVKEREKSSSLNTKFHNKKQCQKNQNLLEQEQTVQETVQQINNKLFNSVFFIMTSNQKDIGSNKPQLKAKVKGYIDNLIEKYAGRYLSQSNKQKSAAVAASPDEQIFCYLYQAMKKWRDLQDDESAPLPEDQMSADQKRIKYAYQQDCCNALKHAVGAGISVETNTADLFKLISFLARELKDYYHGEIDKFILSFNSKMVGVGLKHNLAFMLELYMDAENAGKPPLETVKEILEQVSVATSRLRIAQDSPLQSTSQDDLITMFHYTLELAYAWEAATRKITRQEFIEEYNQAIKSCFSEALAYLADQANADNEDADDLYHVLQRYGDAKNAIAAGFQTIEVQFLVKLGEMIYGYTAWYVEEPLNPKEEYQGVISIDSLTFNGAFQDNTPPEGEDLNQLFKAAKTSPVNDQNKAFIRIYDSIIEDVLIQKGDIEKDYKTELDDIQFKAKEAFTQSTHNLENSRADVVCQLLYFKLQIDEQKDKKDSTVNKRLGHFLQSLGEATSCREKFKESLNCLSKLKKETSDKPEESVEGKIYQALTSEKMESYLEALRVRFHQNEADRYVNDPAIKKEMDSFLALQALYCYINLKGGEKEKNIIKDALDKLNSQNSSHSRWPFTDFDSGPEIKISKAFTETYQNVLNVLDELERDKLKKPKRSIFACYKKLPEDQFIKRAIRLKKSPALFLDLAKNNKFCKPQDSLQHDPDKPNYYHFTNILAIESLDLAFRDMSLHVASDRSKDILKDHLNSEIQELLERYYQKQQGLDYVIEGLYSGSKRIIPKSLRDDPKKNLEQQRSKLLQELEDLDEDVKQWKSELNAYVQELELFLVNYRKTLALSSNEAVIADALSTKYKNNYSFNKFVGDQLERLIEHIKNFNKGDKQTQDAIWKRGLRVIVDFNKLKEKFEKNEEVSPIIDGLNIQLLKDHFPRLVYALHKIEKQSVENFSKTIADGKEFKKQADELAKLDTLYTIMFEKGIDDFMANTYALFDFSDEFYAPLLSYVTACQNSDVWPGGTVTVQVPLQNKQGVTETLTIKSAAEAYKIFKERAVSLFEVKYPENELGKQKLQKCINSMPKEFNEIEQWIGVNGHGDEYNNKREELGANLKSATVPLAQQLFANKLRQFGADNYDYINLHHNRIAIKKYNKNEKYYPVNPSLDVEIFDYSELTLQPPNKKKITRVQMPTPTVNSTNRCNPHSLFKISCTTPILDLKDRGKLNTTDNSSINNEIVETVFTGIGTDSANFLSLLDDDRISKECLEKHLRKFESYYRDREKDKREYFISSTEEKRPMCNRKNKLDASQIIIKLLERKIKQIDSIDEQASVIGRIGDDQKKGSLEQEAFLIVLQDHRLGAKFSAFVKDINKCKGASLYSVREVLDLFWQEALKEEVNKENQKNQRVELQYGD